MKTRTVRVICVLAALTLTAPALVAQAPGCAPLDTTAAWARINRAWKEQPGETWTDDALRRRLLAMVEEDQEIRKDFGARVGDITSRSTGELVTRVTSDSVLLREAASSSIVGLINGAIICFKSNEFWGAGVQSAAHLRSASENDLSTFSQVNRQIAMV